LNYLWGGFTSFGTWISGFTGIYFIIQVIKGLCSMLISGRSLQQTWGCSKKVLLACCPPLANKFIQDKHRKDLSTMKALYIPNDYKGVYPNAPGSPSDHNGDFKINKLTNTGWKGYQQWYEEKEKDVDIYS